MTPGLVVAWMLDALSQRLGGVPAMGGTPPGPSESMTIEEVARELRRSVKGTYRLAAAGQLPGALKVGGKWIVRRSVLLGSTPEGRVSPRRSRR
jgi:hypothetical protein